MTIQYSFFKQFSSFIQFDSVQC